MDKDREMRLKKWRERYYNVELVNVKEEFTKEELELIKKLGIEIMDKIYTEHEFEVLDMETIKFYYEDEMTDEEKEMCTPLPEGVDRNEYNKLLDKIYEINVKYKF